MATVDVSLAQRVELLERQIAELKALLKVTGKPEPAAAKVLSIAAGAGAAATAPVVKSVKAETAQEEGVSPEIMAVISAAVTHFLGLRARIRRARVVQTPTGVSPWAQQGRVFIQASHNLAHR
jgi:hypothetical protein